MTLQGHGPGVEMSVVIWILNPGRCILFSEGAR